MALDRPHFSNVLHTELAALGGPTAPAGGAVSDDTPERPRRVLVVDDEADMRTYLRSCLEPRWQVEEAADGRAALDRLAHTAPALAITDVRMPVMDGVAFTRALKNEANTRHIPVLLISGQAQPSGVGDAFLPKPFSCGRLLAVVERLLASDAA